MRLLVPLLLLALALGAATPLFGQQFPELSGRVVDQADLLEPQQEAELDSRLQALETASSRQLVVATVPDLQGYPIEDFGYQLGRHWKIGQSEANNGTILLVAPNDRKVRIEVGYGLEPILTDALSNRIIDETILPRFRAGDMAGGILAGADAIIQQLRAPPEEAEKRALDAAAKKQAKRKSGGGVDIFTLFFWGVILLVIFSSMIGRAHKRHGRYRGQRYGGSTWPIMLWTIANEIERSSRGGRGSGGWSGGGGGGGFGGWGSGGGFSGGGGSFGGGGASGSW